MRFAEILDPPLDRMVPFSSEYVTMPRGKAPGNVTIETESSCDIHVPKLNYVLESHCPFTPLLR